MDYINNLRQIAYSFASILNEAIASEQIKKTGRLEFCWDENGINVKYTTYENNDVEDGDINA